MYSVERNYVGIDAVEKDALLISLQQHALSLPAYSEEEQIVKGHNWKVYSQFKPGKGCHTVPTKLPSQILLIWSHVQSLAATNHVTEQLSWLTVESFCMSCSIRWMVAGIGNLYLLDLIVWVIN